MISRPIKYRAWTGNEMVAVQSLCFNDKGCIWYGRAPHMGWAFVWPEAEWTVDDPKPTDDLLKPVMQWTGFKDIDGKEIYEGDIVSWCGDEATLVIDYCEEYARFGGLICLQYGEEVENDAYQWFDDYGMPDKLKVIGNVYQTPELLKT